MMASVSLAVFDADATKQQITTSMGAMLLLHSSSQALLQAEIAPSPSPWYAILNQELGEAENLVLKWRQSGFLYFQQHILGKIVACGQAFASEQATIDGLFASLEQNFSDVLQQQIADAFAQLDAPVVAIETALDAYLASLAAFQLAMEGPAAKMQESIAQIQAQEAQISAQIESINAQIEALQQEVITDRQAIAKAQSARNTGIAETIFGIVLVPFTGGLSLILAGIGVGTLTEAVEKVDQLEATIFRYQSTITADQQEMTSDQQQVSALRGLLMSTSLIQSDITGIQTALGVLRTTWTVLRGAIQSAVKDVTHASNMEEANIARLWFKISCNAWQEVTTLALDMESNNRIKSNIIIIR